LISPNSTHPQSSNLKAMFTGEMLRAKAREEKASKLVEFRCSLNAVWSMFTLDAAGRRTVMKTF